MVQSFCAQANESNGCAKCPLLKARVQMRNGGGCFCDKNQALHPTGPKSPGLLWVPSTIVSFLVPPSLAKLPVPPLLVFFFVTIDVFFFVTVDCTSVALLQGLHCRPTRLQVFLPFCHFWCCSLTNTVSCSKLNYCCSLFSVTLSSLTSIYFPQLPFFARADDLRHLSVSSCLSSKHCL